MLALEVGMIDDNPYANRRLEQASRDLMRVLLFTPADLVANRNGQLSEAQRATVGAIYRAPKEPALPLWLALLAPAGLGAVWFILMVGMGGLTMLIWHSLAAFGALFVLVYLAWHFTYRRGADDARSAMQTALPLEGAVRCRTFRMRHKIQTNPMFYLELAGEEFLVSDEVRRAFEDGRRYRVYFAWRAGAKRLLSAELLFP